MRSKISRLEKLGLKGNLYPNMKNYGSSPKTE